MKPYIRSLVSDFHSYKNTLIQTVSLIRTIPLVYKIVSFGIRFYLRIFFLRKRCIQKHGNIKIQF